MSGAAPPSLQLTEPTVHTFTDPPYIHTHTHIHTHTQRESADRVSAQLSLAPWQCGEHPSGNVRLQIPPDRDRGKQSCLSVSLAPLKRRETTQANTLGWETAF